ncbi:membrane-targeted effector domain-containing toxin [Pseudomonas sp. 15FMM2]|uniref:Membrane-targeted effector domain-containing toxin n=1 Tax=Pseudomonas imrae TaxID=2992837 RepID=A0ACC7PD73_9PSED
MSTNTSTSLAVSPIDAIDLMGVLPPPTRAWQLGQLQQAIAAGQELLARQPSPALLAEELFRQAFSSTFSGQNIDPDTVYLSSESVTGAPQQSLTQLFQQALTSGRAPVGAQILAFCTADGVLVDIESQRFEGVVSECLTRLSERYRLRLSEFWRAPAVADSSRTRREVLLQHRCDALAWEAALRRADNLADSTQGITAHGLELVRALIQPDTSELPESPAMGLYRLAIKGADADIDLTAAFMLTTGGLNSLNPVLLYTPQRGLEEFVSYSEMLNELSLRWITDGGRDGILGNVAVADFDRALALRRAGRAVWVAVRLFPEAAESLMERVLNEQLAQQQSNLITVLEALEPDVSVRLSAVLALAQGLPRDLASRPLRPDTLPVLPVVGVSLEDQQKNLVRQMGALNTLIAKLLAGKPQVERFFQLQLKKMFGAVAEQIRPTEIYFTRSHVDEQGVQQFQSSETLEALLTQLLASQEDAVNQNLHSDGAFYVEPDSLNDQYKLHPIGTLNDLVAALRAQLPTLISEFWNARQGNQGLRCELLIRARKQALAIEAALRALDGTLQPLSRALIDRFLQYPTHAARELAYRGTPRPQVYALSLADGTRFAGVFILSGNAQRAHRTPLILWTPGDGFEEYADRAALYGAIIQRLNQAGPPGVLLARSLPVKVRTVWAGMWGESERLELTEVACDFVADSIHSLLTMQQQELNSLLASAELLQVGVPDQRIDLAPQLDIAGAFVARNRRLEDQALPAWQKALAADARRVLQRLELAAQNKNRQLAVWLEGIPSLAEYARQALRNKLQTFLQSKGLPASAAQRIDPDKVVVVKTEHVRLTYSPAPGVTQPVERSYVERVSLTELALKNVEPWHQSLSWTSRETLEAPLNYADGSRVFSSSGEALVLSRERLEQWVKDINVGDSYRSGVLKIKFAPPAQSQEAEQRAQAWMSAQGATLEYEAQLARLNPAVYQTPLADDPARKRGEQWVSAVLASWAPQSRPLVEGKAVVANFLVLGTPKEAPEVGGGQLVLGLLVICTDEDAQRILYAPDAPDGMNLRELPDEAALLALLSGPAWRAYLMQRIVVKGEGIARAPWLTQEMRLLLTDSVFLKTIVSVLPPIGPDPAGLPMMKISLVPCLASLLHGMYYMQVMRQMELADRGSVSNAQVARQSTFNKVMFGIEVAGNLLDMFPWAAHWATGALGIWRRLSHNMVRTFRTRGLVIPGLVLRRGPGARRVVSMEVVGDVIGQPVLGVKPLPVSPFAASSTVTAPSALFEVPAPLALTSFVPPGWRSAAVPQDEAVALLRGLEPNSKGIYRTAAGDYLIRPLSADGQAAVYRIKGDFKLYEGDELTVSIIDGRSRIEVGVLQYGGYGQWRPVALRGGGGGSSRSAADLPGEEFLSSVDYRDGKHLAFDLPESTGIFHSAWFKRDWQRFYKSVVKPRRPEPLSLAPSATLDDLIEQVFAKADGMVLGEVHNQAASITFLQEKMQVLYDRGVRTLYIEGSHATAAPITAARNSSDSRHIVAAKARSCGIRVRGLDDDALTLHRDPHTMAAHIEMSTRLEEMNYFAVRQIETYRTLDDGKWVAWVGSDHMSTSSGVPGLTELTGAFGVKIRDAKPGQATAITFPVDRFWYSRPSGDVQVDMALSTSTVRTPMAPNTVWS